MILSNNLRALQPRRPEKIEQRGRRAARPIPLLAIVMMLASTILTFFPAPASASISPSEVTAVTGCDSGDCGEDAGIDTGDPSATSPRITRWNWKPRINLNNFLGFLELGTIEFNIGYIENDHFLVDEIEIDIKGHNPPAMERTRARRNGVTSPNVSQIRFRGPGFKNFFDASGSSKGHRVSMTGPIRATVKAKAYYSGNGKSVRHVVTLDVQLNTNLPTCDAVCKKKYKDVRFASKRGVSANGKSASLRFTKTLPIGPKSAGYPWGCQENEQGNWRCPNDVAYNRPHAQPTPGWNDKGGNGDGNNSKQNPRPSKGYFTCKHNGLKYYSNGNQYMLTAAKNSNIDQWLCRNVTLTFHVYCNGKAVKAVAPPNHQKQTCSTGGSGGRHPVAKPVGKFVCKANNQAYVSNGRSAYRQDGNLHRQKACNGVALDFHVYCGGKAVLAVKPGNSKVFGCTSSGKPRTL